MIISKKDLKRIENQGILFKCDAEGFIIESNFIVKALIWESSDYNKEKEHAGNALDHLRWSIFSSTARKLAKTMGIKIYEISKNLIKQVK